jgi:hypothetical protein
VTPAADSGLLQVVVAQEDLNGTQIGAGPAYPGAGIASALAIRQTFRCVPFRTRALIASDAETISVLT